MSLSSFLFLLHFSLFLQVTWLHNKKVIGNKNNKGGNVYDKEKELTKKSKKKEGKGNKSVVRKIIKKDVKREIKELKQEINSRFGLVRPGSIPSSRYSKWDWERAIDPVNRK